MSKMDMSSDEDLALDVVSKEETKVKESAGSNKTYLIVSLNVNGIGPDVWKWTKKYLEAAKPDVLFLSETKTDESTLATTYFKDVKENYSWLINSHSPRRFHGVAMLIRHGVEYKTLDVDLGDCPPRSDTVADKKKNITITAALGRVLAVCIDKRFNVVGAYVPNSGTDRSNPLKHLSYRTTKWDPALRRYLDKLRGITTITAGPKVTFPTGPGGPDMTALAAMSIFESWKMSTTSDVNGSGSSGSASSGSSMNTTPKADLGSNDASTSVSASTSASSSTFVSISVSDTGFGLPTMLIGDINVAPADIDVTDPKRMSYGGGWAGFTKAERANFTDMLKSGEWVDVYRKAHPATKAYSWHGKSSAMRLDNVLVSSSMLPFIIDSFIMPYSECTTATDHSPVGVRLRF